MAPGRARPAGWPAATAARTITPAKDSQNPGTSGASGSISRTPSTTHASSSGTVTARRQVTRTATIATAMTERAVGTLKPASAP